MNVTVETRLVKEDELARYQRRTYWSLQGRIYTLILLFFF